MTHDEVEREAQELYEKDVVEKHWVGAPPWEELPEDSKEYYRRWARKFFEDD